jgi:hypothetical protein
MTDAISCCYNRQTECQGYAKETYMTEQGSTATTQYQYCRSEELGSKFVT